MKWRRKKVVKINFPFAAFREKSVSWWLDIAFPKECAYLPTVTSSFPFFFDKFFCERFLNSQLPLVVPIMKPVPFCTAKIARTIAFVLTSK